MNCDPKTLAENARNFPDTLNDGIDIYVLTQWAGQASPYVPSGTMPPIVDNLLFLYDFDNVGMVEGQQVTFATDFAPHSYHLTNGAVAPPIFHRDGTINNHGYLEFLGNTSGLSNDFAAAARPITIYFVAEPTATHAGEPSFRYFGSAPLRPECSIYAASGLFFVDTGVSTQSCLTSPGWQIFQLRLSTPDSLFMIWNGVCRNSNTGNNPLAGFSICARSSAAPVAARKMKVSYCVGYSALHGDAVGQEMETIRNWLKARFGI